MAIITKITVQKKRSDRYNVYLDKGKGEEYAFSVDEDVLIKHRLKKGMDIDEFSLSEIHYQDDIRKSYNHAVHYLASRMRTEHEVRTYLLKKETEEHVIQEVIHKLYEYQFLNDGEFAKSFVRTQMNTTDKGIGLIKSELKEKGVSQEIIDQAIQEYPYEQQLETAEAICEKFIKKNSRDSSRILKQKLEHLLMRKGYPSQLISIAMEEIVEEKEDDEEMGALKYQGEKARRKFSHLSGYEFEQKMKQTLYRKGFPFDLIERYLDEIADEE